MEQKNKCLLFVKIYYYSVQTFAICSTTKNRYKAATVANIVRIHSDRDPIHFLNKRQQK